MCTYWYLLQFIHFQIMWFNNPPFQIWKYDGINYDFSGTWFPIFLCDSISWSNGRNQYFTKFNTKKPYSEFIDIEYLVQGHIIQPFTGSDSCFTIFLTDQKKSCLFISICCCYFFLHLSWRTVCKNFLMHRPFERNLSKLCSVFLHTKIDTHYA